MDMDDPEKEHPVTEQPKKGALVRVKVMIMKWKRDIQAGEDGRVQAEQRKESVTEALIRMKTKAYGEATEEGVKESTKAWAINWQQCGTTSGRTERAAAVFGRRDGAPFCLFGHCSTVYPSQSIGTDPYGWYACWW